MANTSIKQAFERLWQHTVAAIASAKTEINNKLDAKASTDHTHDEYATSSHSHNYAGSSSAGGSATSAIKLDSSAGSATQPVYFSGGKPVATTYTLGASVPSGAKFTDTTYSEATTSKSGLMSAADKIKLDGISEGDFGGVTSWNDLEDKPFGDDAEVVILPTREYAMYPATSNSGASVVITMIEIPNGFTLVENEIYKVELDGVIYSSICKKISESSTSEKLGLGNLYKAFPSSGYEQTGEPFLVQYDPGFAIALWVYNETQQTNHTFTIYATNGVKLLDAKYLPETTATKDYVNEQIANMSAAGQSDWEENDETKNAYIKNKPVYDIPSVTLLEYGQRTLNAENEYHGVLLVGEVAVAEGWNLQEDKTYEVTFNGQVYLCPVRTYVDENSTGKAIGRVSVMGETEDGETNEPFVITVGKLDENNQAIMLIGLIDSNLNQGDTYYLGINLARDLKKLDEKYLPDVAATKDYVAEQLAGLDVGSNCVQADWNETDTTSLAYIKNKPTISADGAVAVQSDWDVVDEASAAYIKNKPFGQVNEKDDVVATLEASFTYQSDANFWGNYITQTYGVPVPLKSGETYQVDWDGVIYTCVAEDIMLNALPAVAIGYTSLLNGVNSIDAPFMIFGLPQNLNYGGIYTFDTQDATHTVRVYQNKITTHMIPTEYIQDMYYMEHGKTIDLLPLQELSFSPLTNMGSTLSLWNTASRPFMLEEGKTYFVEWDNSTFECVAFKGELGGDQGIGIGNLAIVGGENTGEPFLLGCFLDFAATACYAFGQSSSHNVRIYEKGEEIIHHIDPKYIKDMYYTEEGAVVDVVKEKTFTFSLDAQYGAIGIYSCNPVFVGELSTPFVLVENETYKVNWDNTIYECKGLAFDVGGVAGVGIGNASLLYAGDDTGEPFVVLYMPVYGSYANHVTFMTNNTSSSHAIRIYQEIDVVHTLDAKYIEGMYRTEVIEAEEILSSQEFSFEAHPDSKYVYVASTNKNFTLVEGEIYRVLLDCVSYDCVCGSIGDTMYLGNAGLGASGQFDATNPFLIHIQNTSTSTAGIVTNLQGTTHTVGITRLTETVHQIPSKYIDAYTKAEIDAMFASYRADAEITLATYVDEVDALLGGK